MSTAARLALLAAVLTAGLMAGLFAAFSYAVMPGLARTDDATFVKTMQQINVAILNPVFGVCFGGTLLFCLLAAALHLSPDRRAALPWILAGLVLYVVTLVITMTLNVPLNDQLNAAGLDDPAAARDRFEDAWVRWNIVRTVVCLAAFGCVAWAAVGPS